MGRGGLGHQGGEAHQFGFTPFPSPPPPVPNLRTEGLLATPLYFISERGSPTGPSTRKTLGLLSHDDPPGRRAHAASPSRDRGLSSPLSQLPPGTPPSAWMKPALCVPIAARATGRGRERVESKSCPFTDTAGTCPPCSGCSLSRGDSMVQGPSHALRSPGRQSLARQPCVLVTLQGTGPGVCFAR